MTESTQRIDHWLWCARFFKTRSLAATELDKGRIEVNGVAAKPAKLVRAGDEVRIKRAGDPVAQVLHVQGLAKTRGPAVVAQALYQETEASLAERAAYRERMRLAPEPAATIAQGRPTKKDRRDLGDAQDRWQRWSASIDDK